METFNKNNLNQNFANITFPKMYEIVNSQILELNFRELMVVYEMINLFKQQKEKPVIETKKNDLPFLKVQEALKGITGSLSDDIINFEREERV
jgi:hypothetical protein